MNKQVDNLAEFIENSDFSIQDLKCLKDQVSNILRVKIRDTDTKESDVTLRSVVVNYNNVFERRVDSDGCIEHLINAMNQIPNISAQSFYTVLDSYSVVVFKEPESLPKLYICPYCGEAIDLDSHDAEFRCKCGQFRIYLDRNLIEGVTSLRGAYETLHKELIRLGTLPEDLPFIYEGDEYTSFTNAKRIYESWRLRTC